MVEINQSDEEDILYRFTSGSETRRKMKIIDMAGNTRDFSIIINDEKGITECKELLQPETESKVSNDICQNGCDIYGSSGCAKMFPELDLCPLWRYFNNPESENNFMQQVKERVSICPICKGQGSFLCDQNDLSTQVECEECSGHGFILDLKEVD